MCDSARCQQQPVRCCSEAVAAAIGRWMVATKYLTMMYTWKKGHLLLHMFQNMELIYHEQFQDQMNRQLKDVWLSTTRWHRRSSRTVAAAASDWRSPHHPPCLVLFLGLSLVLRAARHEILFQLATSWKDHQNRSHSPVRDRCSPLWA